MVDLKQLIEKLTTPDMLISEIEFVKIGLLKGLEQKEQYAKEQVLKELEDLYISINFKFDEILEKSFIGNPLLNGLQFSKNKIQERIKELQVKN